MRWQTTGVIVPKWTTTKRMHIVLIHWIYFMCANYSIVQGTGFSEELHIDIESWMWSAICLSFACRDNSLVWLNVEYVYDEWLFVHLYATRQVSEWMGKHPTRRRAIPFHSWTIQGAMFRQQIFRAVTCGITTANIHSYSIKTINVCGMVLCLYVCVCVCRELRTAASGTACEKFQNLCSYTLMDINAWLAGCSYVVSRRHARHHLRMLLSDGIALELLYMPLTLHSFGWWVGFIDGAYLVFFSAVHSYLVTRLCIVNLMEGALRSVMSQISDLDFSCVHLLEFSAHLMQIIGMCEKYAIKNDVDAKRWNNNSLMI